MFGRKPAAATIIGNNTTFTGAIDSGDDAMQIDGQFVGTINSTAKITITASGEVIGDISADEVDISGKVEGTVIARENLHMFPTGLIKGDAHYGGTIEVERGGAIEGRMVNNIEAASFNATPLALPVAVSAATPVPSGGIRSTNMQGSMPHNMESVAPPAVSQHAAPAATPMPGDVMPAPVATTPGGSLPAKSHSQPGEADATAGGLFGPTIGAVADVVTPTPPDLSGGGDLSNAPDSGASSEKRPPPPMRSTPSRPGKTSPYGSTALPRSKPPAPPRRSSDAPSED